MNGNGNGSDDEKTPIARVVALNPENGPFVVALRHAAEAIETSGHRTADALRDIATVIQLNATERVPRDMQRRVAGLVREHAEAVAVEADNTEEA